MSLVKSAWGIAKEFFLSKENCIKAFSLLILSIVFDLSAIYVQVILNKWNATFFNAVQEYNKLVIIESIKEFAVIIFFFLIAITIKYILYSKLSIIWRKWMTTNYIDKWMNTSAFYGISLNKNYADNPDQRISEDVNSFISTSLTLTLGLLNNIISFFSFIFILWNLSGSYKFTAFGTNFVIPGYMLWLALIYAVISTFLTFIIGKKLASANYIQEKREANFRFSLARLRENSENVALYSGQNYEKSKFKLFLEGIIENFNNLIKINYKLNIWLNLYNNINVLFPYAIGLPKYLAKEIKLGELSQTSSAFSHILGSFSFFIDSFKIIASYKAIVERLCEFRNNIDNWNDELTHNKIEIKDHIKNQIVLENLSITTPSGINLINSLNYIFEPGHFYLITGNNGSGKSTLIKAIKGIWIFGKGNIYLPSYEETFFIPQKSYMPFGTLLENLNYPNINIDSKNNLIKDLMTKFNISYLVDRINNEENWGLALSLGEQQKIALIRAIIHKPNVLILDESTSAINEKDEAIIYETLNEILPNTIIISVGHRESLKKYHDIELNISKL